MKLTQNFKRILSAMLALVLVFSMVPVSALAADTDSLQTAAIFFSDVHNNPDAMEAVLSTISTNGVSYETIGLVGDTFSENESGTSASMTSAARTALGQNPGVYYAWGSHDEASDISPNSGVLYSGNHYYIYHISDANMRSEAGATATNVSAAITTFQNATASMNKTKVLFIMSHVPLHDRRDDNTYANDWYTAITEVADTMDVVVFWAHNHTGESDVDRAAYYVAKDGTETMTIYGGSTVTPNFTYMNAGYIDANNQNPARKGVATTVKLYGSKMVFQDYNSNGVYTNSAYSHNVEVTREFASNSHEHDYTSEVITAPTCTEDGTTKYTCSCGDTYTETVTATGHNYNITSFAEPTCTEDGSIVYTCSSCSDSYTEVLTAPGHCYETITNNETCTEDGSIVTLCIDCGDIQGEPVVIPASGHNYVEKTTSATCTQDGSTVTTCTYCGDSTTVVHPAIGHNYSATVYEATCTRYGYTKYTCSNCQHYYYDDEVTPMGHKYTTVVTAPSCTNDGFTTSTCENCGNSIVTDTVAALGHSYIGVENEDKTAMVYTCENCQHSYEEAIISGYTYKRVTKFSTDDTFVITLYANKQYYALSHEGNQLSVVPVTVANKEITSAVSEDMLWSYNSKRLYYKDNDRVYYLTTVSTSLFGTPNLDIDTSGPATVSFSSSKLKVGSNYLRFANNVLSLDRNATTTYLFKQAD